MPAPVRPAGTRESARVCGSGPESLHLSVVGNRKARTAAAWGICVAALVFAVGDITAVTVMTPSASSSGGTTAPPSPSTPGGALPVQPVGGGGCIIGLNCGCTKNCHPPHTPPPHNAGAP